MAPASEQRRRRQLIAALSRPELYPGHPAEVQRHETHISWVFVAGERAYKLKKPLVLDFLDYGTPARRRMMCREEVRLNRRLAPDIYLGVRGVALVDGGFELLDDDDPRANDFLVEMRRYDERHTLRASLERGELEGAQVRAVGRVLADFHARAARLAPDPAPVAAAEHRFQRNACELLASAQQRGEIRRVLALARFAHAFISAHMALFEARERDGWRRDGHGDLRAEHVLLEPGIAVVDCVEFDPELRALDVADDLAFLVLDLAARGAERHAAQLVRAYRDAGGNPGPDALIAFYAVHRALIRAKVALVRGAQQPDGSAEQGHLSARARELVALGERFAWRARLPLAFVVCGLPASGKTELASALAVRSGLPHLSSDLTRKRLAAVPPTERAPAAAYNPEFSVLTYATLGRRAAREVATHGGAVVDATFRRRADRDAFAGAFRRAAPLMFCECRAPRAVLVERAARRQAEPARVSDADVRVVVGEQDRWEPLDEVRPGAHMLLRTDRPVSEVVADILAWLDERLEHEHWGP